MGPVLYPIDLNALGLRYSDDWIKDDILILNLPIGTVDIQVSREALGYDSRTVALLKQRLEQARTEIKSHFFAELDKLDHPVRAALFVHSHRYKLMDRVCGPLRTWQGQPLPWALEVEGFRADIVSKFRKRGCNRVQLKSLSFCDKDRIDFQLFARPIPVFIDQGEQKAGQRVLAADWGANDKALWIKTADPKATLDCLGNPPNVIYVRDLPPPPTTTSHGATKPPRSNDWGARLQRAPRPTHYRDNCGRLVHRHRRPHTQDRQQTIEQP